MKLPCVFKERAAGIWGTPSIKQPHAAKGATGP